MLPSAFFVRGCVLGVAVKGVSIISSLLSLLFHFFLFLSLFLLSQVPTSAVRAAATPTGWRGPHIKRIQAKLASGLADPIIVEALADVKQDNLMVGVLLHTYYLLISSDMYVSHTVLCWDGLLSV